MNIILIITFIIFIAFSRFAPHPPNFTPILSIALFSGMVFKNKFIFCIPLGAMLLSDYYIGFHNSIIWVYVSLLLIYLLGKAFFNYFSTINIFLLSFLSSVIFFILSNFGVWLIGYPKTLSGFIACYIAAIPFFTNTLLSTILYSFIFYYGYKYILKNNKIISNKTK